MGNAKALEFMSTAPRPLQGNTAWASAYGYELRRVVREQASRAPRSLQAHLGPSELGSPCDRQVVGKMAATARTNNVIDPWASVVGTAVHAWLADAFAGDNERHNQKRWVPEQRVTPHPNHPGTADLYDAYTQSTIDHKILGPTSMAKVMSPDGPPRKYVVQLLLYGRGYRNLGLPVRRVVLAAYPRTSHTLDGLYVWERPSSPEDDTLIEEVFRQTEVRRALAEQVRSGQLRLNQIPKKPDDYECAFCPFWRPQARYDNGPGCPGRTGT